MLQTLVKRTCVLLNTLLLKYGTTWRSSYVFNYHVYPTLTESPNTIITVKTYHHNHLKSPNIIKIKNIIRIIKHYQNHQTSSESPKILRISKHHQNHKNIIRIIKHHQNHQTSSESPNVITKHYHNHQTSSESPKILRISKHHQNHKNIIRIITNENTTAITSLKLFSFSYLHPQKRPQK